MRKNSRLPNFKNFGIHLRILLIVYGLVLVAAVLLGSNFQQFFAALTEMSTAVVPILVLTSIALYGINPLFNKLNYWQGVLVILLLVVMVTATIISLANHYLPFDDLASTFKSCFISLALAGIVLHYFNLQQRAYSPAIAEARLQALQARIRPHFLFNSINAVLSLIRSQPKQAENALEDMADLFRVLMADNRDLVPLANEIALCRQYLSIEKLRLADRLTVNWDIADMPPDALIPPLILQPLLENAVYHGIEPLAEGGTIDIGVQNNDKELVLTIRNPYAADKDKHQGNKMALKNIKERLLLHFDLEASVKSATKSSDYQVQLRLPTKAIWNH